MGVTHLLKQTLSIKNPSGATDGQGRPALGAATSVKARVELVYKTILNQDREAIPIHAEAVVGPGETVAIGAQATFDSQVYRVMVIKDAPGRNGDVHHYELMLQLWNYG